MLFFTHNNVQHRIRFSKSVRTIKSLQQAGLLCKNHRIRTEIPDDMVNRNTVKAEIQVQRSDDSRFVTIASGLSIQNPKDRFNPIYGKKLALSKAFKHLLNERVPIMGNSDLEKQERKRKKADFKKFSLPAWNEFLVKYPQD